MFATARTCPGWPRSRRNGRRWSVRPHLSSPSEHLLRQVPPSSRSATPAPGPTAPGITRSRRTRAACTTPTRQTTASASAGPCGCISPLRVRCAARCTQPTVLTGARGALDHGADLARARRRALLPAERIGAVLGSAHRRPLARSSMRRYGSKWARVRSQSRRSIRSGTRCCCCPRRAQGRATASTVCSTTTWVPASASRRATGPIAGSPRRR